MLESDNCDDLKVVAGGEGVSVRAAGQRRSPTRRSRARPKTSSVMTKKLGSQYLVCARNLSAETKVVDIGWAKDG